MALLWWAARRTAHRLGFHDVGWAALMAASALFVGVVGEGSPLARLLVAAFGSLWGARLCLHLLHRRLSEAEDARAILLHHAWGPRGHRYFVFFQLQAATVALLSLPLLAAAASPTPRFDGWAAAAFAVWAVALAGEIAADRQLARFRADPAQGGRTLRTGLWAWSRHPNYFFEWLHGFAYVLLAANGPHSWLALLGPLLMFGFLTRVSGIPWSEAQALRSRGRGYRDYQREVSAFFPWPPGRTGR